MEKAILIVEFKGFLKKQGGILSDNVIIIPEKAVFSWQKSGTVRFRDGWQLIAKEEMFEIQYPSFAISFHRTQVKRVLIECRGCY